MSHCTWSYFYFLMVSSEAKAFNFDDVQFNYFFCCHIFGAISKKPSINPRAPRFAPMFSYGSCIVLAHAFKATIHLFFETGSHSVTQAHCSVVISDHCSVLLLHSSNSPASASRIAGIAGESHFALLSFFFLNRKIS